MLIACFCALLGVLANFWVVSGYSCSYNQMPCDDGTCIKKTHWCDGTKHCHDDSDEMYCGKNGGRFCRENHFECSDGMCIPLSSRCDNFSDCPEGSDEIDCPKNFSFPNETELVLDDGSSNPVEKAIKKAARWTWKQLQLITDDSNNICRSIVALRLINDVYGLSSNQEKTMAKKLELFLNIQLTKNGTTGDVRLGQLATYINALRAACLNPRHFLNRDLVKRLRSKVDSAISSKEFNHPFAGLTLCLVNEVSDKDIHAIHALYTSSRNLGVKALCLTALACIVDIPSYRSYHRIFKAETKRFVDQVNRVVGHLDTYTKSLILQALNSEEGYEEEKEEIKQSILLNQLDDGSFGEGDVLSTYLALPGLLDMSLLSLKHLNCPGSKTSDPSTKNALKISIWLGNQEADSHTLSINFDNNSTLYEVMQLAAKKNPLYRFQFDKESNGKMIYSIAGLPNDVERGMFWTLYEAQSNGPILANSLARADSLANLKEIKGGIDNIRPKHHSHFVFWLKP